MLVLGLGSELSDTSFIPVSCKEKGGKMIIAGPIESELDGMASGVLRGNSDEIMQGLVS